MVGAVVGQPMGEGSLSRSNGNSISGSLTAHNSTKTSLTGFWFNSPSNGQGQQAVTPVGSFVGPTTGKRLTGGPGSRKSSAGGNYSPNMFMTLGGTQLLVSVFKEF